MEGGLLRLLFLVRFQILPDLTGFQIEMSVPSLIGTYST